MKPSIGRIVHYNDHGTLKAAIIVLVGDSTLQIAGQAVNLKVFEDGSVSDSWRQNVLFGTGEGMWKWPDKI